HGVVLVDLGPIVNRHVPAAEIDHPSARGAVRGVERRLLQQGFLPSEKVKGRAAFLVSPPSVLLPERLRRSRAPVPLRWTAADAQARSLSRCYIRPGSPLCLSDCGSYAFGGRASSEPGTALSCTDEGKGTVALLGCQKFPVLRIESGTEVYSQRKNRR